MQTTQLRYFVEICRQENVTRAAESLHITQPSLSIAVRNLEEQLGVRLFYRRKGRLYLTEEGEFFLSKATAILDDIDELEAEMHKRSVQEKRVRIGISMISAYIFRDLFREFGLVYPKLTLELGEYDSLELEQLLIEDKLDLGIGMLTERTGDRFHLTELVKTPIAFCVRKEHPLAGASRISVEDLKDQPLIMARDDNYHTTTMIMERFRRAGIEPKIVLRTSQFITSKKYVCEQNIGSFEMEEFAKEEPELVRIPLDPPVFIHLGLIWRKGYYLRSGALRFMDFASQYAGMDTEEPKG